LIRPVTCASYQITLEGHCPGGFQPKETFEASLLIETQHGGWSKTEFWLRICMAVLFTILTVAIMIQWICAACTTGAPMGSQSIIVASVAMVLFCDPVDLLSSCMSLNWHWNACRLVGQKLLMWYPPRLIGEVLADLNCRSPPQVLPNGPADWGKLRGCAWRLMCRCRCSASRAYRWAVAALELAYLVYFISIAIWLSSVVHAASVASSSPVSLAGTWAEVLQTAHEYKGLLSIFGQNVLVFWSCIRLFELIYCLRGFPYSVCREHHITSSWLVLTLIVMQVLIGPVILSKLTHLDNSVSKPWHNLNSHLLGLVFPSAVNANIAEVSSSGLYVLIFATAFGPYRVPAAVQVPAETSFEPRRSTGSEPRETRVSIAPVELQRSRVSEHPVRSLVMGQRAFLEQCGRQPVPDPMVTLSTVRILAHCSLLVYNQEIREEQLRVPIVPHHEDDLRLGALRLKRVLTNRPLDIQAMVATAHLGSEGDWRSSEVVVLAFRGTNSAKNVRTDFMLRLDAVQAPNTAALAEECRIGGVRVHQGFQTAMLAMRDELLQIVRELGLRTVWITGHSLGGALATLVAVELHLALCQQVSIALCTFGSPRVGNQAFTRLFRHSACKSVRVVVDTDPVPSFLSACQPCLRYEHVSGLIRVFKNGHLVARPSFLEEMLPWLVQHTFLPRIACWCCCFCRRGRQHTMSNYIKALHAVHLMEGYAGVPGGGTAVSVPIDTSFVPSEIPESLPHGPLHKNLDISSQALLGATSLAREIYRPLERAEDPSG